jgi:uncharacterized protein
MPAQAHNLDLASLRLSSGEARRLELAVAIEPLTLGGECYAARPSSPTVTLEVSRMLGHGYTLRLRFEVALVGPCMRCLGQAGPVVRVDALEVDRPGEGDELSSPYVQGETLDLAAWAHDAFMLSAPVQVVCRADCAGLCPVCAADLNDLDPARPHHHERPPDPRWAKLRDLQL